jgi:hypothetical protein
MNSSSPLEVNIDFDGAIEAWNKNKKKLGNGNYQYVSCYQCQGKTKTGDQCKNKTSFDFCRLHTKGSYGPT